MLYHPFYSITDTDNFRKEKKIRKISFNRNINETKLIQSIIKFRYECEEDEFLRELEGMQRQIPERISLCEDIPILGTFINFFFSC